LRIRDITIFHRIFQCLGLLFVQTNRTGKLRKTIAGIIQTLDKPFFVIMKIHIPRPTQHNHFDFVYFMSSHTQREESIVHLFERIKIVQQSPHRTRFSIDITFGHSEIIGAKNTFPRTSKRFRQYLDWNYPWLRSDWSFFQNILQRTIRSDIPITDHLSIVSQDLYIGWYVGETMITCKWSFDFDKIIFSQKWTIEGLECLYQTCHIRHIIPHRINTMTNSKQSTLVLQSNLSPDQKISHAVRYTTCIVDAIY